MRLIDDIGGRFGRPSLALDFRAESIGLYRQEAGTWRQLAAAALDKPDFQTEIAQLTQVADETGLPRRVELWLPTDQILNRRMTLDGSKIWNRRARVGAILAEEAGVSAGEISFDIAPSPSGVWSVTAADREVVEEAIHYARKWGFAPARVTTRHGDAAFVAGPQLFKAKSQKAAIGVGAASFAVAAAAAAALMITPPAPQEGETATLSEAGPMKVALAPSDVAEPESAAQASPPTQPAPLWPLNLAPAHGPVAPPVLSAPVAAFDWGVGAQPQVNAPKTARLSEADAAPTPGRSLIPSAKLAALTTGHPIAALNHTAPIPVIDDALTSPAAAEAPGGLSIALGGAAPQTSGRPTPIFAGLSFDLAPSAPSRIAPPIVEDAPPADEASSADGAQDQAAGFDRDAPVVLAALTPLRAPARAVSEIWAGDAMRPAAMAAPPTAPTDLVRVAEITFAPARDDAEGGQAQVRIQGAVTEDDLGADVPAPAPRPRAPEAPTPTEAPEAAEEAEEAPGPGAVARAPRPRAKPVRTPVSPAQEAPTTPAFAAEEVDIAVSTLEADTPRPKSRPTSIKSKQTPIASTGARSVKAPARSTGGNRGVAQVATLNNVLPLGETSLLGVFGKSDSRRALVRLSDGAVRRVKKGSVIDGWVVTNIGKSSMKMTQGGRSRSLPLVR